MRTFSITFIVWIEVPFQPNSCSQLFTISKFANNYNRATYETWLPQTIKLKSYWC